LSHEKFEDFERRLESEPAVPDLKYRLAKSRLPVDSPYVGNFHRGYKLCKRQFLDDASQKDLQLSNCPYIDTTMFDCEPLSSSRKRPQTEEEEEADSAERDALEEEDIVAPLSPVGSVGSAKGAETRNLDQNLSAASHQTAADQGNSEDKASGAVTPVLMFEKGPPPSPSASWRSACAEMPPEASLTALRTRRRCAGQQVRSLSFNNVRECLKAPVKEMPASPELCGVQAILPRRCGLSVQSKLGEGSFGKVVLAINNSNHSGAGQGQLGKSSRIIHKLPKTGAQVVLKCIKKSKCDKSSAENECLEREVLIHGQVDHIHIPRMLGYYEDDQNLTLILDLIPGKELKEVMMLKRTMPEQSARLICLQVARALQHLHHVMGVVHRDVNPRNILLGQDNRAWLIDLGLAVDLNAKPLAKHLGGTIQTAGTIGYMPPEARGGALSTAFDMWALGTIIYECMFGFSPFLPHELHLPTALVQFPDPAWGLNASEHVKDVITSLLCKDAPKRMRARELLAHGWADAQTLGTIDCLFAEQVAEREETLANDEQQHRHKQQQQLLAVDLLSGKHLGQTTGTLLAPGETVAVTTGTLLPRTASIDEEIENAQQDDQECQSLMALWTAVAWSSSARWSAGASYSHQSPICHEHDSVPPLGNWVKSPPSTTSFGSLGLLRRSNSETHLAMPSTVPY